MSCDPCVSPGQSRPSPNHSPSLAASQASTASRAQTSALTTLLSGFFIALCFALTLHTVTQTQTRSFDVAEPGWVIMPAGARSAYLGIHGGTVPVSLLVSSTGTSLISFVGQTGNDFLALLRRAELRLPSLFNNSTQSKDGDLLRHPEKLGSQTLSAGSSSSSLPVISLSDDSVFSLTARPGIVRPFGFSDTPLQIEGNIALPDPQVQQPRYHILVEPQYLQPR